MTTREGETMNAAEARRRAKLAGAQTLRELHASFDAAAKAKARAWNDELSAETDAMEDV